MTWSSESAADTITTRSDGPSCAQAVVTFVARNANGDPLWAFASTYYDMTMGGIPPEGAPPAWHTLNIQAPKDPSHSYIPFFVYNGRRPVPNPAVIEAMRNQEAYLRLAASGALTGAEALNALTLAAAANKYGAVPAY